MDPDTFTIRDLYVRRYREFKRDVRQEAIIVLVAQELQIPRGKVEDALWHRSVPRRAAGDRR